MMPSLTVVFSSDTDICFSPGLYGDCLPTIATAGAADSFRAESLPFRGLSVLASHARTRAGERTAACGQPPGFTSHRHYGHRQHDMKRL
ncbi:hypothetical protein FNV62_17005 [Streptomyces sp. RLB3-17]|nr:hypothetical protein FNV67_18845 [Streptomyces sp. S1D4-20]QDN67292.1 hypothetical protein FNV66_18440 [Streptomyces sp. S1D4-14]QDN77560.1 hypothetical protein FNV64_19865 [Streptomyces sp. S1A1-7]QDN87234.1 hypothetical protein FNV61_17730 [Streptomyces sp. RLB3-6]QDN97922.1 hypothetical protein FNV58_19555 [Streptomyces sp. RLB1-9]QDO08047.1 hypothetical protein FNV68_18830 [Streptomyces sp. S1D4-23]QDO19629.1 hypothetical protein FNV65_18000 [Streptomyces sp. S1A1-8]QDO29755.1 hypothe